MTNTGRRGGSSGLLFLKALQAILTDLGRGFGSQNCWQENEPLDLSELFLIFSSSQQPRIMELSLSCYKRLKQNACALIELSSWHAAAPSLLRPADGPFTFQPAPCQTLTPLLLGLCLLIFFLFGFSSICWEAGSYPHTVCKLDFKQIKEINTFLKRYHKVLKEKIRRTFV